MKGFIFSIAFIWCILSPKPLNYKNRELNTLWFRNSLHIVKYHTYNNFKGYLVGNDLVDIELNGKKKYKVFKILLKFALKKWHS